MQSLKLNTFVIPFLGGELIHRCLETLYEYTPDNFYVFIIDQSIEGLDPNLRDKYKNLMIIRTPKSDLHHTGNLGFSLASNLGIRLADTPYVTFLNDDVEFINSKWWDGILKTFDKVEESTPTRPAMIVNAASIKLPDWSVGRSAGDDFYILPYKEKYTEEDWRFLVEEEHYINEHLTIQPGSVIDGINLYCSVADTKKLLEVGSVDDFYYPGGAEDYDLSCRSSMFGYRSVGTTYSWVYHHWSQTFKNVRDKEEIKAMIQPELTHASLEEKWGYRADGTTPKFDLWGARCSQCEEILQTKDGVTATCPTHKDEKYQMPENTIVPL